MTHAAWARGLHSVVAGATEAVIWLSTWGDSNRMKRDLDTSKAPNARQAILPRNSKDVFTPEELAHLRERQKDALEKARSLPELSDEEEARILTGALSDPDALPLTDEQLSRMRPAHEVLPELVATWLRQKRGRPPVETPKKQVTLRLDQDVLDHFKSSGPGWQTRINDVLRNAAKNAATRG